MRLLFLFVIAFALEASAETRYELVRGWPVLPAEHSLGLCARVGVDSHNHVFVYHRNARVWSKPFPDEPIAEPTVSIIDGQTGKLLSSWGGGEFIMPHGLTIDHEDHVWLTDVGRHQVFKYTKDGRLLMTLGERGKPGDDHTHFNLPTDVAVLPDGSFYVSDGYRNTRVVKFTAAGQYEFEWGGKGSEPGKLHLPHGIAVDKGRCVYVCDRSNARLQVFDSRGAFIAQWAGPEIGRPYGVSAASDGHIFLIDGGDASATRPMPSKAVELDANGQVLSTFGFAGEAATRLKLGHDVCVGSDGSVYVADAKGRRVQKFIRKIQ